MHGKGCCVFASGAMCDLIESLASRLSCLNEVTKL